MSEGTVLGGRIPRHDAIQQVTGRVIYGEDLYRSNMLYAKALYSQYAHAKILEIDLTEAQRIPGVRGIITAKDVPYNRFGYSHKDQPVLAEDKVRYKGDALAVIAADSLEIAEQAVASIKVTYEPLPIVFNPYDALAEDAPRVHDSGNLAAHIKIRHGDIEKGFNEADFIIEDEFSTQKVEHCHIEPHVALAELESDGKLVVWTSNSRPFVYITQLIKILNLPMHKCQIRTPAIGGGFGGKNEISLEPWVALLTLQTRLPVKMVFTREDEFTASSVRHPYLMKYKSGLKKDGTLTARQIELLSDSGAYVSLGKETLTKAAMHSAGPYNIPNIKIDARLVYTNRIVGAAMRGFGVPQVCFAYEVHTDKIAERLGLSPIEFRLKNLFYNQGNMPTGQVIKSHALRETFNRALALYNDSARRD